MVKYNATQGLLELIIKSRPHKNIVILQDGQAYKQILLQSNEHQIITAPPEESQQAKS